MHDIYRDPTEGAVAKRHDLLGQRRGELATMPHSVRRVVVARWARIIGSISGWVAAELMVIAAVTPALARWVAHALPGDEPAPLSTLIVAAWAVGLVAYWIARSGAEHRFAVEMSRTVLPGEDLFHDIERLDHVHPDEVARQMAHRLEVMSAALPVAAAACLVPATAAYVAMGVHAHGWPSERAYETWLAAHASGLAWLALGGVGAAVLMTRRAARLPVAAPVAAVVAVGATGAALVWWWFAGVAAIALTIAIVGRRLRKERELIQAEDPAAGSEVLTLRGMLQQLRATIGAMRGFVRTHRRVFVTLGLVVAVFGLRLAWRATAVEPAVAIAPPIEPVVTASDFKQLEKDVAHEAAPPAYRLVPAACDHMPDMRESCLRLEVELRDGKAVDVPSVFPGLRVVPEGWHAKVGARLAPISASREVVVTVLGGSHYLDDTHSFEAFEVAACGQQVSAGLRIEPDPAGPPVQHATLLLDPRLELAHCGW